VATVDAEEIIAGPFGDENSLKFAVWNIGPRAIDVFSTDTGVSIRVFDPNEAGMVDTVGPVSARLVPLVFI